MFLLDPPFDFSDISIQSPSSVDIKGSLGACQSQGTI